MHTWPYLRTLAARIVDICVLGSQRAIRRSTRHPSQGVVDEICHLQLISFNATITLKFPPHRSACVHARIYVTMIIKHKQDEYLATSGARAMTWDEVQEFGGQPFQPASPSSISSSHSSTELSSYAMVSHSEAAHSTVSPAASISLATLPAELVLATAQYLQYPDLLALRHTHPRFLNTKLLSTSNRIQKVDWLVDRRLRGLEVPMHKQLRLDSDAAFCSQAEVRAIMRRRLRHGECAPGPGGCLLVDGSECGGPRSPLRRAERFGRDGWVSWGPTTVLVIGLALLLALAMDRSDG